MTNKIAADSFGVVVESGFLSKDICHIMATTGKGIVATVVMRFLLKASTTNFRPMTPDVVRTVGAELLKGYITDINVDVEGPQRIASVAPPTIVTRMDVATEDLLSKLSTMGL